MNRYVYLCAAVTVVGGLLALGMTAVRADNPHAGHHAEHFAKCAKACADCQLQCDMCFTHCRELLAEGKKEHAKTVQTCADCGECCKLAATLSARQSPYAVPACDCCAKCCDDCAAACEKFPGDTHMAACAKACRDCAKACRDMIAMTKK
jgi:hypothetical protein